MAVLNLAVDLVERFRRNQVAYRSGQYNETQVRRALCPPEKYLPELQTFPEGAQPQSSTDYLSILVDQMLAALPESGHRLNRTRTYPP